MRFSIDCSAIVNNKFHTVDNNVEIVADSTKSACIQYLIETGNGDATIIQIDDIGTKEKPCIRYCVKSNKKLFVYVMAKCEKQS